MRLDITDEAHWAAAIERTEQRFGRLDVLVSKPHTQREDDRNTDGDGCSDVLDWGTRRSNGPGKSAAGAGPPGRLVRAHPES